MTLPLYKQTNIEVDIKCFIKNILKLYYSMKLADGDTFNDEINSVVKDMTNEDLYEYNNTYAVMQTILDRAIIYATSWHYPQTDIEALEDIASLI